MTRMQAAADGAGGLTRERPIDPAAAALLVIDVQNYCAVPGLGEHAGISRDTIPPDLAYYFERLDTQVLPNIRRQKPTFGSSSMTRPLTRFGCSSVLVASYMRRLVMRSASFAAFKATMAGRRARARRSPNSVARWRTWVR